MKKMYFPSLILLASVTVFTACGGKGGNSEKDKTGDAKAMTLPELPKDYKTYDLNEHGMDLHVSAPADAYIYTFTMMDNDGEQQAVNVQMNSGSTDKVSISVTSSDLAKEKERVEKDMFRKFKSVLAEKNNGILYEYENKDKGAAYGFIRIIEKGGKKYLAASDDFMNPVTSKDTAALLFQVANSLK
jgi:hypothetical protein